MLPDGRRLGAHLPMGPGMVKAVVRAHAIGADAIQIFTDNPTAWQRRAEPPRELAAFRAGVVAHDVMPVAIHASYLVNLAGSDLLSFERSVALLTAELRGAPTFGARFVNVHIGSHRGDGVENGTKRLADGVAQVFARVRAESSGLEAAAEVVAPAMLVLENSAGGGGGLGTTIKELAAIADAVGARGLGRHEIGFCLDTAHAWGAGIDIGDPVAIDDTIAEFDERIGLDRLVMVHLNDTRSLLGSRADRHEHLGAGRIGAVGLAHVLCHPGLARATYYLETPGMDKGFDAINLARAMALATGRALDPLPSAAFELGGSARARTAPA